MKTAIIEKKEKTAYEQAVEALDTAKQQRPVYTNRYDKTAEQLYAQLMNRPQFTYDAQSDALYQNYKHSYMQQGRTAMTDTMGRAASLTGGYGSSYSQSAGQQQYNAYLEKLTEVFPETYKLAYENYQAEGQRMQNRYDMIQDLSDKEYQQYQDRLSAYYQQISQLQQRADVEFDRTQQAEQQAYDRAQDDYKKQQDAYDRLADMVSAYGYVPGAEELAAAGMTEGAMQAYRSYYLAALEPAASGGSGGGRRSSKKSTEEDSDALEQARKALKRTGDIEQVNGGVAQKVTRGEITPEEGRSIVTTLTKEHFSAQAAKKK